MSIGVLFSIAEIRTIMSTVGYILHLHGRNAVPRIFNDVMKCT